MNADSSRRSTASKMHWRSIVAAMLLLPSCIGNAFAQAQTERELIRRGEGRIDLTSYLQENEPDGSHQYKWVLRAQRPWLLPDDWKLTWHLEAPLLYTNKKGPANEDGNYSVGLGDVLGQIAFTTPKIAPDLTLNFGLRVLAPSGGRSPFGASQWEMAPQVGLSYDVRVAPGYVLELDPLMRYFRGVSTTHADITKVRTFDFYPSVTLRLPDDWAIGLWNENPLIYNGLTDKWFVPFDIGVIKRVNQWLQVSAGGAVRLISNDTQYKYTVYGRLSTFF